MLIPWSRFWERNYFAILVPALQSVITNHFVRGAISGLGLVNLWLALLELGEMLLGRRGERPSPVEGRG
ncbi:MAG: hypothetical protein R2712_04180 [Vicinamibacterales bacterium]